ncbi:unnamed protein product [Agarophyton chilense]
MHGSVNDNLEVGERGDRRKTEPHVEDAYDNACLELDNEINRQHDRGIAEGHGVSSADDAECSDEDEGSDDDESEDVGIRSPHQQSICVLERKVAKKNMYIPVKRGVCPQEIEEEDIIDHSDIITWPITLSFLVKT